VNEFEAVTGNPSDSEDPVAEWGFAGRIVAEFDPRLAEVWLAVFESDIDLEQVGQCFGWFLRMAYLKGYEDAMAEPEPGGLYANLGMKSKQGSPSTRRRQK